MVCPLAERDFGGPVDVVTPYGFGGFAMSGDCARFAEDWAGVRAVARMGLRLPRAQPSVLRRSGVRARRRCTSTTASTCMDLRGLGRRAPARLSQNRRRQLRDWPPWPPDSSTTAQRLTDFLLATYADFFARRGRRAAPPTSRRETMAAIAALDDVLMVGAGRGRPLESVAVFGHTPYAATTSSASRRPGGERHAVHLIWAGASSSCARSASKPQPRRRRPRGGRRGGVQAPLRRRRAAAREPAAGLPRRGVRELCRAGGRQPRTGPAGFRPIAPPAAARRPAP